MRSVLVHLLVLWQLFGSVAVAAGWCIEESASPPATLQVADARDLVLTAAGPADHDRAQDQAPATDAYHPCHCSAHLTGIAIRTDMDRDRPCRHDPSFDTDCWLSLSHRPPLDPPRV